MKRVLLIAHDFPPRGGTGVLRVAKFVRYLPDWGWEPVVITAAGRGPYPDDRLLQDLPAGLEVVRVPVPGVPQPGTPPGGSVVIRGGGNDWRQRLKPWIVPDPQILWVPWAVRAAHARLRNGDIQALMTSAPPFSTSLTGWWLKRRNPTLPWLMDLRDLWSESSLQHQLVPYKLNRFLEQQCLSSADHTTVVSDGIRTLTIKQLGVEPERISTLTNGFDPNDLPADLPVPDRVSTRWGTSEPLRMRYVGSIGAARAPDFRMLFEALRQLPAEGLGAELLRIEFVGAYAQTIHDWVAPLVRAGLVVLHPFVPHDHAVRYMADADVLMLFLTNDWEGRIAHSNKLFEYLAVGRPILAIAPEGEATQLVRDEQAGITAPHDPAAIVQAITALVARRRAGRLSQPDPNNRRFARFERRALAGQLAARLNALVR